MISSSLRGMDSQTEKYKYKYNIVDFNDRVIILTVFYVYFDVSYINILIDGMNKNKNEKNEKKKYMLTSTIDVFLITQHIGTIISNSFLLLFNKNKSGRIFYPKGARSVSALSRHCIHYRSIMNP
jgi:hypothetical protein